MKSSVDYNATIGHLGMGDTFRLEQHSAAVTVAWTDFSVDGSVVYVRDSSGDVTALPTFRRCFITEHAPRCDCGRRFENCDQGCYWPEHIEALASV